MKILVIAAHPDDEVLGCGGIILKHIKNKDDVVICILTDGSLNRYSQDKARVVKEQALQCAKFLGLERVIFKDLPNQALDTIPILKVIQTIEEVIREVKPEIIYTHDKIDLNHDHRIVYEASLVATRPLPENRIRKMLTYFVPASSEHNNVDSESTFIPNLFVDIKEEIDQKVEAFSFYKTEAREYPHPRSSQAIKVYAKYWGISVGLEYVEPFRLIREIEK